MANDLAKNRTCQITNKLVELLQWLLRGIKAESCPCQESMHGCGKKVMQKNRSMHPFKWNKMQIEIHKPLVIWHQRMPSGRIFFFSIYFSDQKLSAGLILLYLIATEILKEFLCNLNLAESLLITLRRNPLNQPSEEIGDLKVIWNQNSVQQKSILTNKPNYRISMSVTRRDIEAQNSFVQHALPLAVKACGLPL